VFDLVHTSLLHYRIFILPNHHPAAKPPLRYHHHHHHPIHSFIHFRIFFRVLFVFLIQILGIFYHGFFVTGLILLHEKGEKMVESMLVNLSLRIGTRRRRKLTSNSSSLSIISSSLVTRAQSLQDVRS
jgi:hypothetical protein